MVSIVIQKENNFDVRNTVQEFLNEEATIAQSLEMFYSFQTQFDKLNPNSLSIK